MRRKPGAETLAAGVAREARYYNPRSKSGLGFKAVGVGFCKVICPLLFLVGFKLFDPTTVSGLSDTVIIR